MECGLCDTCFMSRRAAALLGRAQLRALILGGAVWDAFRGNANCGDPVGSLWVAYGSAYISPGPNWENPAKFRLRQQNSGKVIFCTYDFRTKFRSKFLNTYQESGKYSKCFLAKFR